MKVLFDEPMDIGFNCEIETEDEVKLVAEKEAEQIAEAGPEDKADLQSFLCIGGSWVYNLNELHEFVQKGVYHDHLFDQH